MLLLVYFPLLLLAALLYRLMFLRIYHRLPIFFSYVIYAVSAGTLRLTLQGNRHPYFVGYWATEAGYVVVGGLVLYEFFRIAIGKFRETKWFRLPAVALALLGTSAVLLHVHTHPQWGGSVLLSLILAFEFELRLMQGFLFAAFLVLMFVLGVQWPQYVLGVITGFGFYAGMCLVDLMNFRITEGNFTLLWGYVQLCAYTITVLIWLWTFRLPPEAEPPTRYRGGLAAALNETEQYLNVLKKIRGRKPL